MTVTQPTSLDESFERLVTQHRPTDLTTFYEFINTTTDLVRQFRMLAQAVDAGYAPVFSIDLCELLDNAYSFRQQQIHPHLGAFRKRRVLNDIAFSRAAIRAISDGPCPFTILPGTAAEILSFLRCAYGDNAKLASALRKNHLEIEDNSDIRELGLRPQAYKGFQRVLRGEAFDLGLVDNLVSFVGDLLEDHSFVDPTALQEPLRAPEDSFADFLHAVDTVRWRKKGALPNKVDALNLTIAHAFNNEPDKKFIVHMTRTESLHRLFHKRRVRVSVSMTQYVAGTEIPILCSPKLTYLLSLFVPGKHFPEGLYDTAERAERTWGTYSSHLRRLFQAMNKNTPKWKLRTILDELETVYADPEFANTWNAYVGLFMASAGQGLEFFAHRDDLDDDELEDQEREAAIASQQADHLAKMERIHVVYDAMRSRSNLTRVKALANLGHDVDRPIVLAESDGYRVKPKPDVNGNGFKEYVLETLEATRVAVGIQVAQQNGHGQVCVYWPSPKKAETFLGAVFPALAESATPRTLHIITSCREGAIQVDEFQSNRIPAVTEFLAGVHHPPISALQIVDDDNTYTWESLTEDRAPWTSVRCLDVVPAQAQDIYRATNGSTSPEYFQDFASQICEFVKRKVENA